MLDIQFGVQLIRNAIGFVWFEYNLVEYAKQTEVDLKYVKDYNDTVKLIRLPTEAIIVDISSREELRECEEQGLVENLMKQLNAKKPFHQRMPESEMISEYIGVKYFRYNLLIPKEFEEFNSNMTEHNIDHYLMPSVVQRLMLEFQVKYHCHGLLTDCQLNAVE